MLQIISRITIPRIFKLEYVLLYFAPIFCLLFLPVNLAWGNTEVLFGGLNNRIDVFTSENVVIKERGKGK